MLLHRQNLHRQNLHRQTLLSLKVTGGNLFRRWTAVLFTFLMSMAFNGLIIQSSLAATLELSEIIENKQISYVLLGELHDAKLQHEQRLEWLKALAQSISTNPKKNTLRPSLALEQFDSEHQSEIDAFLAGLNDAERSDPATALRLAKISGFNFKGWTWSFYEPALQLALKMKWPVIAANLSSQETLKIARGGAALMLEEVRVNWSSQNQFALATEIREGHCNALPERMIEPMSLAQRARDVVMAKSLVRARAGGVVILLAGNGHVRRDLGVPRYLQALDPAAQIFSVGQLESSAGERSQQKEIMSEYDLVFRTLKLEREDPCETFKKPR